MARAKKRTKDAAQGGEATLGPPVRRMEALGIVLLVLALALSFALVSYDSADRAGRANLIGPVGRGVASLILGGVGVIGYVIATLGVIGAGAVLVGRARWPRALAVVSALGLTLSGTVFAHLVSGGGSAFGQPAGGMIGAVLGELMRGFIGAAGAGLAAMGLFCVSLLGVADVSFGAAMKDTYSFLKLAGLRVWHLFDTWREAQSAESEHEERLIEEEANRRLEAEKTRAEKEQKLKEQLEEKKRAAILKAQAKAEEKVLARRAAEEAKARLEEEERLAEEARLAEEERLEQERLAAEALVAGEAMATDEAAAADPVEAAAESEGDEAESEEPEAEAEEDTDEGSPEAELKPWEVADTYVRKEQKAPAVVEDPEALLGPAIIPARRDSASEAMLEVAAEPVAPVIPVERRTKKNYELPPLKLLDYKAPPPMEIDGEDLRSRATRLEEKLRTYGVDGRVTAIRPGPVVTTYEYLPAPGVKVSKIAGLSDDIAMAMTARSVRIIAPIPGKGVVGIELPNESRENVFLKELIAHDRFSRSRSLLTLALGKDTEGEVQTRDLAKMPHILIAGTTGSGKSVSVNAMILSILYKATPDQVKFIMVDPKMLELSLYDNIPHLLLPVVTDAKKASLALQWAVDEMERRYKLLSELKVRNIEGFNKKLGLLRDQRSKQALLAPPAPKTEEDSLEPLDPNALLAEDTGEGGEAAEEAVASSPPAMEEGAVEDPWTDREVPEDLPYIVVLVDEFADLMCVAPRDVELSVQRLAQKARAAGIHLMLATQRPSTDVITGVIKNNFPSRLSFRVASRHDSSTIINQPGAENLLGMGDMLALGNNSPEPVRIHGAFVSEEEVQRVVDFWKAQGKPVYDQAILRPREDEEGGDEDDFADVKDEMYDRAVAIVVETKKASISAIQRRLRVGYNRAARMVELMEREGIVSAAMGPKGDREVLVSNHAP
ncbi:MAG: DNA translocase FtsK 4TM domain-containing protein [Myxococcota bacterium]